MKQSSRAVEGPLDATVVPLAPKRASFACTTGLANPLTPAAEDQRFTALAPKRVQLSRAAGWRMPENTVKVDRTTKWGNPFVVGRDGTQAECVEAFGWLAGEEASLEAMARVLVPPEGLRATETVISELQADPAPLRGKNLACWCSLDQPCHADVLLRLANYERPNDKGKRTPEARSAVGGPLDPPVVPL